jgi:acyl carrier protein
VISSPPDARFLALLGRHLKYLKPGQELEPDQPLRDLGLDSMASIDLLLDLEEEYGIVMPEEYLTEQSFSTAAALWQAVGTLTDGAGVST